MIFSVFVLKLYFVLGTKTVFVRKPFLYENRFGTKTVDLGSENFHLFRNNKNLSKKLEKIKWT